MKKQIFVFYALMPNGLNGAYQINEDYVATCAALHRLAVENFGKMRFMGSNHGLYQFANFDLKGWMNSHRLKLASATLQLDASDWQMLNITSSVLKKTCPYFSSMPFVFGQVLYVLYIGNGLYIQKGDNFVPVSKQDIAC